MNLNEFQKIISKADKPVMIDFWAAWCAPCRMTKPILEKLAQEYEDRIEFIPVDADDSREVLEKFNIMGIPTVLAFREGKEIGRITGAQNEAGYRTAFESLAEGKEVKIPMSPFDRTLRLAAGTILAIVGVLTNNLFVVGIGGIVAFLGIYDRCPVWAALTRMVRGQ